MIATTLAMEAVNVAGIVGGGVTVTAAIGYAVKTYFQAKRKDDNVRDAKRKADKDDDETRASLREIDAKLAKAGKDLTQHQLDDAQSFAHLETQQAVMETKINHIQQTTSIMAADLKEVLRRTPRNTSDDAS